MQFREVELKPLPPSGHGRSKGLVSNRASGQRIEAYFFAPPPDLEDVVAMFWVGRWSLVGQPPHTTEMLGDPCVHLVVEALKSRIVGVWSQRWVNELRGEGLIRAAKLRAGAFGAFLSGPAAAITDKRVPMAEMLPIDVASLEQGVLVEDDGEALAVLVAQLRSLRREDPDTPQAVQACERILADRELTSVEELAAQMKRSVRSLQRLFRQHVGISPKQAIVRARIQEAALQIEMGAAPNLARLAADLEFTDEAHFCRAFKAAVGRTPREFEAEVHRR